jgi:hypothetical protein
MAAGKLAEGEELVSNLLRVPQSNLGDPGGLEFLRKRGVAGGGRFQRPKGPLPPGQTRRTAVSPLACRTLGTQPTVTPRPSGPQAKPIPSP